MPKASKRERLLDATKELLWEVGFEAMSPRDIQERSEARPGSLYHHFPSKLAIAGEAMSQVAANDIERIDGFFAEPGPAMARVEKYLYLDRDSIKGCRFGRLVNETAIEHPELRGPVTAFFDAIRNNLAHTLARAQTEGVLPPHMDPQTLAVTLLALIQGGAVLARSYNDEAYFRRAMDGAMALLAEATRNE